MGSFNGVPRTWRILVLIVLSLVVGLSGITAARKRASLLASEPAPASQPASQPAPKSVPAKPVPAEPTTPPPSPEPQQAQQAPAASQNSSEAQAETTEQESADMVRARSEWFHDQRAYPFKQVPTGALQRAIEQRDRMISQKRSGVRSSAAGMISIPGDGVWHLTGPQPTNVPFGGGGGSPTASGRVTAVAVDTTDANGLTIYSGAAAGGVWKTTDGGANWTPLTDNQLSLAVGSIAIDPTNNQTIYVGTGEDTLNQDSFQGTGVLKSTDGGAHWTQIGASTFAGPFNSATGGSRIGTIAVDPANNQIVLAGALIPTLNQSGIYRSIDGGVTWTLVVAGDAPGTSVVFDPAGTIAYAAVGSPLGSSTNGIYKSTDHGATWITLTGGLPTSNLGRIELTIAPSTTGAAATVYAAVADSNGGSSNLLGLFVTTNAGVSWTQLTATPNFCLTQCWYDIAVAVHPTNPNFVVVGGLALFKSTDGGVTWSSDSNGPTDFTTGSTAARPHSDTHALVFTPLITTNSNLPRLYTGDDGGVYRTDDPTPVHPVWVDLNATLALTQFYPGTTSSVSDENYGFGGTQDNNIQLFSGTLDWTAVQSCGDGGFTAVDQSTPTTIYAGCSAFGTPKLKKSVFYGAVASFNAAETEISASGDQMQFIPPLAIDGNNSSVLYFGTCRIWQTTDGAATWHAITGDLGLFNDPGCPPSGGLGYITTIDVSQQSSGIVLAGTNSGKVWETTNATLGTASTWNNIDHGLLPIRSITAARSKKSDLTGNIAYVTLSGFGSCSGCGTTPGHVFKTIDGGTTWKDISGNLPDAPVNDILVDHSDNPTFDALYIATDVGVFTCADPESATPCSSWTVTGDQLPNSPVLSLSMRRVSRILRAATHGRSMWAIQLTDQPISPQPLLSSMTPAAVMAGASTTTLAVLGANLSSKTLVLFNGLKTGVNTTFVSTTQLTVTFDTSLLINGGVFNITLTDPQGSAGPLPFTVMNSIPIISGLSSIPSTPVVGEPVTFHLTGAGFVSGTTLMFNGIPVSGGTPSAGGAVFDITVPGADLSAPGMGTVTAVNPLPGGGPSPNSLFLTIVANVGPEAVFTPPAIVFPGQDPGTTSPTINVTISNPGGAPLTLTGTSTSGINAGDFKQMTPTSGMPCDFSGTTSVPAGGGSCSFGMAFSPPGGTAPGTRTATLTVNDNDDDSPQSILITGSVTAAVLKSIAVTPTNPLIAKGQTQQFKALGTFSDGSTLDITTTATWASGTTTVATIGTNTGLATGVGVGSTTLTATQSGVTSNTAVLTVMQTPAITSANSTTFTVAAPGTFTVTATGSPTPTLSETGTLPAGVTFTAATGVLAGTPASGAAGSYPITFTAHNGVGTDATQSFTLTVNQASVAPAITSAKSTTFTVGTAGTFTVTATGSPTPTLSETGTLPAGVTFTAATGVLAGTPAPGAAGSYPITFTAHNGVGTDATQSFTLTVTTQPLVNTNPTNQTVTAGSSVSFIAAANGNPAPTVQWQVSTDGGTTFNNAAGAASTTLTFTAAFSQNGNKYRALFTNAFGTATTTAATLTVNNTVPTITTLSPIGATAGGVAFTLTVGGTNFNGSSTVNFNGSAKITTFVSVTQIAAAIPAADIAAAGPVNITVTNPAPGGGTTANQVFTIVNFALTQTAPGTVQVSSGTPTNVVLNLATTPAGAALPADVNYTCTVAASFMGTTCAMNPTKTLAGSTSGNTTLTITTTASVPPSAEPRVPLTLYLQWMLATALAGLMAIYFTARQKALTLRGRTAYLAPVLLVIVMTGIAGCATGSITALKGQATVTVTATSGNVIRTLQINISVK
jgi:hypothetical protein